MKKTPFHQLALLVYKSACVGKIPLFSGRQVEEDLIQLHPGERLEWVKKEYYVQKIALFLVILAIGILFALAAKAAADTEAVLGEGGVLKRGSPGEDVRQLQIRADYGGESYDFQIGLSPRQLSKGEAEKAAEELVKKLPGYILGGNASMEQITSDLILQEKYGQSPVTVEWESSRPEILGDSGEVEAVRQREEVELRAALTCGEYSREETFCLTICPKELSASEKIYEELGEYLSESEKQSRQEPDWVLPESWRGEVVGWSQKTENRAMLLWLSSLLVAVVVYFFSDRDLHKRLEQRRKQLQAEYADLVHEMVLLVGAGMTPRGVFQKLAADYEKRRTESGEISLAYEEVVRACRDMKSGVAEGAAYERFGRRTGLQQYVRLSGLLIQNLKRGNHALPERLREEAYKAGEEKLQLGRKLGEEAGTKLLVPMVMMLAVVMLLIMVPAFSSL